MHPHSGVLRQGQASRQAGHHFPPPNWTPRPGPAPASPSERPPRRARPSRCWQRSESPQWAWRAVRPLFALSRGWSQVVTSPFKASQPSQAAGDTPAPTSPVAGRQGGRGHRETPTQPPWPQCGLPWAPTCLGRVDRPSVWSHASPGRERVLLGSLEGRPGFRAGRVSPQPPAQSGVWGSRAIEETALPALNLQAFRTKPELGPPHPWWAGQPTPSPLPREVAGEGTGLESLGVQRGKTCPGE